MWPPLRGCSPIDRRCDGGSAARRPRPHGEALARAAGVAASTAPEHIGRLERGGVVVSRRDGRERWYGSRDSLPRPRSRALPRWRARDKSAGCVPRRGDSNCATRGPATTISPGSSVCRSQTQLWQRAPLVPTSRSAPRHLHGSCSWASRSIHSRAPAVHRFVSAPTGPSSARTSQARSATQSARRCSTPAGWPDVLRLGHSS
jgi:hypothetical protein